jgi:DNA-binding Xre family transcriptional regulator
MTDKSDREDWPAYGGVNELFAELDLNNEDLGRASQIIDDHVRAWHLAQVRAEQDRSQGELAIAMGVTQPRVSALERGDLDSVTLSTLRAYVRALGGKLSVIADFGDGEYRLT